MTAKTRTHGKRVQNTLARVVTGAMRGMLYSAGAIENIAVQRAPADIGNLRKSAEIYVGNSMRNCDKALDTVPIPPGAHRVVVAFTADYAERVHNASGALRGQPRPPGHKGRYWDPQGTARPKFLESAARDFAPQIPHYVADAIKVELRKTRGKMT